MRVFGAAGVVDDAAALAGLDAAGADGPVEGGAVARPVAVSCSLPSADRGGGNRPRGAPSGRAAVRSVAGRFFPKGCRRGLSAGRRGGEAGAGARRAQWPAAARSASGRGAFAGGPEEAAPVEGIGENCHDIATQKAENDMRMTFLCSIMVPLEHFRSRNYGEGGQVCRVCGARRAADCSSLA